MFCSILCFGSVSFGVKILRMLPFFFVFFLFFQGVVTTAFCEVVHIGISSQAVFNVNINDVLATIKAWSQNAAKNHGLEAIFDVNIIQSSTQLCNDIEEERLEIVVASINEILPLDPTFDTVFIPISKDPFFVRYVLVVHRKSSISTFEELNNKVVALPQGNFMQLAELWFDTYLQKDTRTSTSFSLIKKTDSKDISKVGMQVFFDRLMLR